MNEKKFIVITVAITLLIIGGAVAFIGKNEAAAPKIVASQDAKAEVSETSFDWGTVKMGGAKATKTFTIKNVGSSALKLYEVKTSCACTSAQMIINGTKSPYFGMHTQSTWVGEVSPGSEAQLEVIFDQDFHGPQGVGDIARTITIKTNDQNKSELTFNVKATVIK